MKTPISVLVVDDDFNIANMHSQFVNSIKGYQSIGEALNYKQAISKILELNPDLVLLDVFMPDKSGIDLLRTVRSNQTSCDIILITAAKELKVVEEGFRLGVFDYLIKPFDLNQLKETLKKYIQYQKRMSTLSNVSQEAVEDLKNLRGKTIQTQSQKGIDARTLDRIKNNLMVTNHFLTIDEIVQITGVSRSTARNYMVHMVQTDQAEEKLQYGTIGRPQSMYRLKD